MTFTFLVSLKKNLNTNHASKVAVAAKYVGKFILIDVTNPAIIGGTACAKAAID